MSNQNSNIDSNSKKEKKENIQEAKEINNKDKQVDRNVNIRINQKEQELEEYKKQAEENLAGWQRAKADFINYKKDQEKYSEEFRKYACEDIIVKLLPTIDNFELAIDHLPEDLKNSDWVQGVICIKSQFDNFLKEAGVEKIKAVGEKFDPTLFESVGEEESDQKEGIIVAEIQKGYKMHNKIIRPAKVIVVKKKTD